MIDAIYQKQLNCKRIGNQPPPPYKTASSTRPHSPASNFAISQLYRLLFNRLTNQSMAFLNYFLTNAEEQPQAVSEPPAYVNVPEEEDVKCGSKPCGEKPPKPCNPCNPCPPPKPPCNPCHPKPPCGPLPPPPKPCCTPCPPRPPKPCPKPCPKPPPCRKPCNPCDVRGSSSEKAFPDSSSSSSDSSSSSSDCRPFPSEPLCIYNACELALWVSLNLLFTAISLVVALGQPTVNVLNVIFFSVNLAISFLGLAGLYNNCCDYIQLAAWWQWIAVPVSLLLIFQVFSAGASALLAALESLDLGTIGNAIVSFLASLPLPLLNLLFTAVLVAYAAALIFFAFEWAQAACARCVIVDCDRECGWFKTTVELVRGMIPVPVSLVSLTIETLGSLCPNPLKSAAPTGYGSFAAAAEKADQAV